MRPADRHLLGYQIEGLFFFDVVVPFGSVLSVFKLYAHEGRGMDLEKAIPLNHCDPVYGRFLFIGSGCTKNCHELVDHFLSICSDLGVSLAADKAEGPSTILTFSGTEATQSFKL